MDWTRITTPLGLLRVLPDFLVIGAEKCGTTSLYRYLVQHPNVAAARQKEPHFFDYHYDDGLLWYRSRFPSAAQRAWARHVRGRVFLTGEASPDYIFHPLAPGRAHATVPDARLVALLRHPVDRAWSHYQQQVRKKRETLSFEEAIEKEEERTGIGPDGPRPDLDFDRIEVRRFSYLSRGMYAQQLERWIDRYGRDRLLVVRTDDLSERPAETIRSVVRFLGLPDIDPARFVGEFERHNAGGYRSALDPDLRKRLVARFAAANRRLEEMTGARFHWEE